MRFELEWKAGFSKSFGIRPEKMVQASVPGNANLDWALATGMPDWKFGTNFEEYRWMEDCWWVYDTRIPGFNPEDGEKLFFVTKGIDYEYIIKLDGQEIYSHEGMFSGVDFELSAKQNSLLEIWIAPVPKDPAAHKDTRDEAAQCCKPAVSYGWDWHPRLIPMGVWDETYLELRPADYLAEACLDYELSEDFSQASILFTSSIIGQSGNNEVMFTLFGPEGNEVLRAKSGETAVLENPKLWWCNGYGEPNLYRWEAILTIDGKETGKKIGKKIGFVGFRTIELTMNEGAWDEPADFPKGRSPAPITITLNGVNVFAKGSNWVNPEVFTGTITRDTYQPLIKLAMDMNFNIFRCWGGAIINKEAFYELCNENGILVWQEFMLACNNYRGTAHYLTVLEQEAKAIINRLKRHPCLAIWCGGNELFNSWSLMTDQSPALRLLNKICYELDPKRPFLMTSPLFGMAHGNYLFRYQNGDEVFQAMPKARNTAYTEFGVPSISNLDCCKMAADLSDIFPMEENAITVAHHAFFAWNDREPWACLSTIRDYFGEAQTLEQLIGWSQWLQGEGYKCIIEEARRQKPDCSMAINWCYNEPWPTLANNSLINYPANPKESCHDVSDACRNALISARLPKFAWRGGETFSADLWLLNDGREPISGGWAEVILELNGEVYSLDSWNFKQTPANTNLEGPTVRMKLPMLNEVGKGGIMELNQGSSKREKGKLREMNLVIKAGALSSRYRLVFND